MLLFWRTAPMLYRVKDAAEAIKLWKSGICILTKWEPQGQKNEGNLEVPKRLNLAALKSVFTAWYEGKEKWQCCFIWGSKVSSPCPVKSKNSHWWKYTKLKVIFLLVLSHKAAPVACLFPACKWTHSRSRKWILSLEASFTTSPLESIVSGSFFVFLSC